MNRTENSVSFSAKKMGKTCAKCQFQYSFSDFYKKGNRRDSRCKRCVLATKAAAYKRERRGRKKKPRIDSWTISETYADKPSSVCLESLLRDFFLEVLLDDEEIGTTGGSISSNS